MPESRDRLSRPVDISSLLPNAQRRVNLMVDEPGLRRRGLCSPNATRKTGQCGGGRIARRGVPAHRTPLRHHRRYLSRVLIDQENRTPEATTTRVHGRRSALPSWYPRTPLRDITAIARAIERRRAELRDQRTEESEQDAKSSLAITQGENEMQMATPMPSIVTKPQPSHASQADKIMDSTVDEKAKDSFTTPQKKLLNSIEKLRQIWVEEQRKLEKTPAARKAERDKKVRTLMSMR